MHIPSTIYKEELKITVLRVVQAELLKQEEFKIVIGTLFWVEMVISLLQNQVIQILFMLNLNKVIYIELIWQQVKLFL